MSPCTISSSSCRGDILCRQGGSSGHAEVGRRQWVPLGRVDQRPRVPSVSQKVGTRVTVQSPSHGRRCSHRCKVRHLQKGAGVDASRILMYRLFLLIMVQSFTVSLCFTSRSHRQPRHSSRRSPLERGRDRSPGRWARSASCPPSSPAQEARYRSIPPSPQPP